MAGLNDILTMDRLPAMPAALARALPILLDPDSDLTALERVIRQDEALVASVLRLANSVRYGAPGRHFDLRRAMARLGRQTLTRCILGQQVSGAVSGEVPAFGLQRGTLWRSSLGGAIAAEDLARKHSPADCSLAFVCGLLRDIGKLALNVRFGAGYFALFSRDKGSHISFIETERATLGFDHAQVGAALARKWALPERIARAIETHHAPPSDPSEHDPLLDLVHAADVICLWAGFGVGFDGLEYRLAEHVRISLSLDRRSAEREIAFVGVAVREAEDALGQPRTQGTAA